MVAPLLVNPQLAIAPVLVVTEPLAAISIRGADVGVVVPFKTVVGAVLRVKNRSLRSCPASSVEAVRSVSVTPIVPEPVVIVVVALTGCKFPFTEPVGVV